MKALAWTTVVLVALLSMAVTGGKPAPRDDGTSAAGAAYTTGMVER